MGSPRQSLIRFKPHQRNTETAGRQHPHFGDREDKESAVLGKHCDKFVLRLDRHGFKRPSFIDSDKGFAAPDTRRHIAELRNKAVAFVPARNIF